MNDELFVCLDKDSGDIPVLVVGRIDKRTHVVDIINALQDDEAIALYNKLIGKEDKR